MTGLTLAFDAAFPPGQEYPGSGAVMGYVGGNTPHIWTRDEWLRFQNLRQFPIWVGYLESDPVGHANDAIAAVKALGWAPNYPQNTRAIVLDFETEIDPTWVDAYANVVDKAGFLTIMYGSESTIVSDPVRSGRWIALYNGQHNIPNDPGAIGHQFSANVPWDGTQVDLSVVTDAMLVHGGVGPRK